MSKRHPRLKLLQVLKNSVLTTGSGAGAPQAARLIERWDWAGQRVRSKRTARERNEGKRRSVIAEQPDAADREMAASFLKPQRAAADPYRSATRSER
jgi:hypothetical protein